MSDPSEWRGQRGGTGAVYPEIQDGADGEYWIKLKRPIAGLVLYTTDSDPDYTYIVPCRD